MKNNHPLYKTPFGDFNLIRIPDVDKNLQAWNSADLYILNTLYEKLKTGTDSVSGLDLKQANILIINDAFGALTIAMAQFACDTYGDSFISHEAIRNNINENCPNHLEKVNFIKSTDLLKREYDVVLFKNSKTQSFLKDEMLKIAPHIRENTLILGASMAKQLQKSTLQMLNNTLGMTNASLTWKKARLIHIQPDTRIQNQFDNSIKNSVSFRLEGGEEIIHNLSNVFSRNKLDIGSRFFLQHLPGLKNFPSGRTLKIVDLGCGNGVLALKAAQNFPGANIICVDDSYMAVASAKMTLEANLGSHNNDSDDNVSDDNVSDKHQIDYIAGNGLTNFKAESVDLILCNPPFHQQYVVGDTVAWQMFQQSKRALIKGGELWVVGNRHLGYHLKLKKIFGNQKLIATNTKFVVLKAVKR